MKDGKCSGCTGGAPFSVPLRKGVIRIWGGAAVGWKKVWRWGEAGLDELVWWKLDCGGSILRASRGRWQRTRKIFRLMREDAGEKKGKKRQGACMPEKKWVHVRPALGKRKGLEVQNTKKRLAKKQKHRRLTAAE